MENKANPNAADDDLRAPLHFAAENNCIESLQMLLDSGACVNAVDSRKNKMFVKRMLHFNMSVNIKLCWYICLRVID